MKLALWFLVASAAFGQLLSIDLAGEWRVRTGDDPAWAAPDYDDRSWQTVRVPLARSRPQEYSIRRSFQAPAQAAGQPLVLTVGGFALQYEVFLNGVRVATAPEAAAFPQARLFDLPAGSVVPGANVIALRKIGNPPSQGSRLALPNAGPFLITSRDYAPRLAPDLDRERRVRRATPSFALMLVFGILGLLLIVLWVGEPRQIEFLLLALLLARDAFNRGQEYFTLLFEQPILASNSDILKLLFALTLLRIRIPVYCWIIALCAQAALPLFLPSWDVRSGMYLLLAMGGTAAIAWRWKRLEGGRLLAFCGPLMFLLEYLGAPGAARPFSVSGEVWGLLFRSYDLVKVLVAVGIIVLLVRRLIEDRRDKERLTSELEAARTVQQLLVSSAIDGIEAVYRPAQEVGGDFYWCHRAEDGSVVVATGDVSGKGLKAAMLVSVAIGSLRTMRSSEPIELLAALNRAVAESVGGGFVTCCIARIDGDSVKLANAGHPSPYHDGQELDLPPGLPLGLAPDADYTEVTISLTGQLTFLSDGVIEAVNAKGELFGFDRTRGISTRSAAEIAEAARAWGQNDDITVVTVRRIA